MRPLVARRLTQPLLEHVVVLAKRRRSREVLPRATNTETVVKCGKAVGLFDEQLPSHDVWVTESLTYFEDGRARDARRLKIANRVSSSETR